MALNGISVQGQQTQIANEIAWFQQVNRTEPSVFLAYDREAYSGIQDPKVRITFDTQLRYRTTNWTCGWGMPEWPCSRMTVSLWS